jgi:hypothetical protein
MTVSVHQGTTSTSKVILLQYGDFKASLGQSCCASNSTHASAYAKSAKHQTTNKWILPDYHDRFPHIGLNNMVTTLVRGRILLTVSGIPTSHSRDVFDLQVGKTEF